MSEIKDKARINMEALAEAKRDEDQPESVNSFSVLGLETQRRMLQEAGRNDFSEIKEVDEPERVLSEVMNQNEKHPHDRTEEGDDMGSVLEHSFDEIIEMEKTHFDPPNVRVTLTWETVNIKAILE